MKFRTLLFYVSRRPGRGRRAVKTKAGLVYVRCQLVNLARIAALRGAAPRGSEELMGGLPLFT